MKLIDKVLKLRTAYTKEELLKGKCPDELYLFDKVKFKKICDKYTDEEINEGNTSEGDCEVCWNQELDEDEES